MAIFLMHYSVLNFFPFVKGADCNLSSMSNFDFLFPGVIGRGGTLLCAARLCSTIQRVIFLLPSLMEPLTSTTSRE